MNSAGRPVHVAALAALAVLAACQRNAQPPAEVGGISIGMSVEDYRKLALSPPGFKLGGVSGTPTASFSNGKLDRFDWHFPTMKYLVVRGALAAQFPQMKCETALGFEVCTVGRSLWLSEGTRGGSASHLWLEPKRT